MKMHGLLSAFLTLGAFQALTVTAQDPACLVSTCPLGHTLLGPKLKIST